MLRFLGRIFNLRGNATLSIYGYADEPIADLMVATNVLWKGRCQGRLETRAEKRSEPFTLCEAIFQNERYAPIRT